MAIPAPSLPNYTIPQNAPPDLLGMMGKMATLRQMNQLLPLDVQEKQQQVQASNLENQQRQISMASQKAMMDAVANGDLNKYAGVDTPDGSGFDAAGAYQHLLSMKVLPEQASQVVNSFQTIAKNNSEIRKNMGAASGDYLKNRAESHQQMGEDIAKILDTKDPAAQQMALDTLKSEYQKTPLPGMDANDLKLFQQADLEHLPAVAQVLKLDTAMDSYHAKLSKEQSEAAEAKQKVIPAGGGMSPDIQQQLAKDVALSQNPEIQQGKVDVAKAEGAARAQVELAMEPLRLQLQQQFGDQKDARDKIESSVLKPYQDKMTDVNMAKTAIAQAATNPVAARAAVFKMVGVAQPTGSHRVLPMEFAAFKYPGGIGTQIQEKWNNFLKGEPWTPEIASAANAFIDGQAQAAQQNLNSGVDNVNKLYGTSVGTGLKQSSQANVIYARDPQGNLHSAAPGTALPAGWKVEKAPQ